MVPELKDEIARLEVEGLDRIRERIREICGRDLPVSTHICGTRPQLEFLAEKFGDGSTSSSTGSAPTTPWRTS